MKWQAARRLVILCIVLALAAFVFLYPLQYYIKKPGQAYNAAEFIDVAQHEVDAGEFRFTTVAMMKATPFLYVLANILPNQEVVKIDQVFGEQEDEKEYETRQIKLMDESKFNALKMAFEQADIETTINYEGIVVLNIVENSAAENVLQTGDVIEMLNGEKLETKEQFAELMDEKKRGDQLTLQIERDGVELEKTLNVAPIPGDTNRYGLGITYTEQKMIETTPEVEMDTERIGGPSAGLMFTLEIMNQLVAEDLTKGHIIAGTGTMEVDGTVGRIGGIDKKVVAAHRAGAEYFFAPDDEITDSIREIDASIQSNYEEALEQADKIGTTMKIVPIKTLADAVDFLNKLK